MIIRRRHVRIEIEQRTLQVTTLAAAQPIAAIVGEPIAAAPVARMAAETSITDHAALKITQRAPATGNRKGGL